MMNDSVFVNRILNMRKIKYIGLDMDHTLLRYNTKNFESLVYQLVIDILIKDKNYPEDIQSFQFNFDDAIRGLVVDSKNGNILKLSRFAAIRQSYHGTQKISYAEQNTIYRSIYVDLKDPNYIAIDTSFSIAFCVLYGQLIDLKDQQPLNLPSYMDIAADVLSAVDQVHADGQLKSSIMMDMDKYVLREKDVVEGLKRYVRYGKKIFLLTNSEYYYTNLMLNYSINPFLDEGQTWRDLFEFIITSANKPRFFYDNLKFLIINPQDGCMSNMRGAILPGVYQGGNARQFTVDLGISGDEILYIGDHIYGDILRLKKDCNWRTALVVEELGQEIASQKKAFPVEKKIVKAMNLKKTLEQTHTDLCSVSIEAHSTEYDKPINDIQKQVASLDAEIAQLLQKEQSFYNTHWGRVFRSGAEESYFAYQVERFACIYMEKLSDLLRQSPLTYFRSNRRLLPHDMDGLS